MVKCHLQDLHVIIFWGSIKHHCWITFNRCWLWCHQLVIGLHILYALWINVGVIVNLVTSAYLWCHKVILLIQTQGEYKKAHWIQPVEFYITYIMIWTPFLAFRQMLSHPLFAQEILPAGPTSRHDAVWILWLSKLAGDNGQRGRCKDSPKPWYHISRGVWIVKIFLLT